ncbi:IS607 family element RNA-guided endonuclease TnpB [Streptomyces sp. DSM 41972]|uniref:IS607 family element RNA-guided endonuclease TnpB n=1 Tax=Streptomyces althioticus subsp. attaecolombicae TaxID=3075534 RepID=A0ABU3HUQ8_9ACTN|nr:IS607 family element RNA-guided endonuclease TnpB [Streptomyces sp. DSM 41972]SCD69711.1 putative transposase [Streptomyces sp. di50b]SCD97094.1 putative transposase [Streptomyces sp. di188]
MKRFQPQPGCVVQAYRFALDPNATQEHALRSHCGAARAAYNWAVGWVTASWWQRRAEETYKIPEESLTEWRPWSLPSLRKAFNEAKHTDPRFSAWWEENSKEAYSTGLANASAAFDNYAKSKNGKRKGARMGVPRFKPKRKARLACRFTTGVIRVDADGRHVTLPRLGTIHTHEPTVKLLTRVQAGTARILSATVRHERGRWFASFQTEVKRDIVRVARPDAAVGIDLGVKTLAVMADSTGEIRTLANPGHYDAARAQLRRASRTVSRRQGPDRRTGQKPSRRWEKANAARNRVHHRVANLREDALHKLTTAVAAEYGTVVVEDLNVAGMLRNRRLARRIADAGFGEIRRQLTYKTRQRHATRIIAADRWYPSSKTCSGCGAVKAKLPLHVRTYQCDACHLVIDRDDNAALNLAALAAAATTGTGVAGDQDTTVAVSKPRGADQKTRVTRPRRKAEAGRAGGATLPHQRQTEARDRTQAEALTLR